jgi:hypothetical protein
MYKELIPSLREIMIFHKNESERYYSLMYVNPGKYSRYYGAGIPFGYEEEIKTLRKLRNWHLKKYREIRDQLEE